MRIAILIVLALAVPAMGQRPTTQPGSHDIAMLMAEIADLRAEIASLKAENAALKNELGMPTVVSATGPHDFTAPQQLATIIPRSAIPPKNRDADDIYAQKIDEALKTAIGGTMLLRGKFTSYGRNSDGTIWVGMNYDGRPSDLSGIRILYYFTDSFAAEKEPRVARIHRDGPIAIRGTITSIETKVEDKFNIGVHVQLKNCELTH